jgi:hypothetical protein
MAEHVRIHHAEYASPQQPEGLALPYAVWENMRITQEEELAMGVKEFLIPREFTQVACAVTEAAAGETLKRSTAQGTSKSAKRGRTTR